MAAGMTDELSAMSFAAGDALFLVMIVQVCCSIALSSWKCSCPSLCSECLMPSALKLESLRIEMTFGIQPSVCTAMVGLSSCSASRPSCTSRVLSFERFILMRNVMENAETMSAFFAGLLWMR